MAMDPGRRHFMKHEIFARPLTLIGHIVRSFQDGAEDRCSPGYFDSFDYCHPLIAEAGDMLLEEAAKQGVATEGRSKAEIARELFRSKPR
ncbi:MAG: hypothetical protein R6X08_04325 [Desulfosalsimonadaceae bacterium]